MNYFVQGKRIVASLNEMGWTALGLGETDFALGLDYLKELEDMAKFPFISANVLDGKKGSPIFNPFIVKNISGFHVGITSVIGDKINVSKSLIDKDGVYIEDHRKSLARVLKDLKKESDFIIVLAHTGMDEAEELAGDFDEIDLIIVGHQPHKISSEPIAVGNALLTQMYSQGQYISRLDIKIKNFKRPYNFSAFSTVDMDSKEYKNLLVRLQKLEKVHERLQLLKDKGADISAQEDVVVHELELTRKKIDQIERKSETVNNTIAQYFIALNEDIEEDSDIVKIAEKYKTELIKLTNKQREDLMEKGKRNNRDLAVEPHYVGFENCASCHSSYNDFWLKTKHARAYETLKNELRQFEISCIQCHTTGFEKAGGFNNILTAKDLLGVQCEVCHGPGSLHISNGNSMKKRPSKKDCLSCHNEENDDDFQYERDISIIRCPVK